MDDSGIQVYAYARLKCKAWGCPDCGPRKATRLRKAITVQATERGLARLMTLTLNPSVIHEDCEDHVKYIRCVWAKFRVYLGRRYGRISFIAVLEFHKSGIPHLHVLVDRFIPQPWIKATWDALGGGHVVDIRWVDMHRIANYLSKYLTKSVILSAPPRTRRYTTSRDIQLFPRREPSGWWLTRFPFKYLYARGVKLRSLMMEDLDRDGSIRLFTSWRSLEAAS